MPFSLRNRPADNWRPLISIADSFGGEWGARAREAALAFTKDKRDEDIGVVLLTDIRKTFNARGVDRISSEALVAALIAINSLAVGGVARCELLGFRASLYTDSELAKLLDPFGIYPKTVWPLRRHTSGTSSSRGYMRADFEDAWESYCDVADTRDVPATPLARLAVVNK